MFRHPIHETFLTQDDIRDTQESIRKHVLKFFGNKDWFHKEDIEKMKSLNFPKDS